MITLMWICASRSHRTGLQCGKSEFIRSPAVVLFCFSEKELQRYTMLLITLKQHRCAYRCCGFGISVFESDGVTAEQFISASVIKLECEFAFFSEYWHQILESGGYH